MRLAPGTSIGPYQVVAVLGTGGMAEVYRARDVRLKRDVALKVVNDWLRGDLAYLARLEQEARLAGSLNHPNIVAVYDVGSYEDAPYVVTELLEGETLRQRLTRGRVPISSALDWAVQMAEGLHAAHEHGVVHRDLKPENVFLTRSGHVKLLDFGIAKASAPGGPGRGLSEGTLSVSGSFTGTGAVLGTPGYMSPEQVQGDPLDRRSDIFSLGAVLYELLCGRRAFPGGSVIESGHAILHDDPEPLPDGVAPALRELVRRCLEKDPSRRFQSARDVGIAIELVRGSSGSVPASRRLARARPWMTPVVAVAAAVALGWAAFLVARRGEPGPPSIRQLTFRRGSILSARYGPDGRTVYFTAAWNGEAPHVYSTTVDAPEARLLDIGDAELLAVSPTGELAVALHPRMIAYDGGRGTLARVPAMGGAPRELATGVEYADWAPDGERLAVARWEGAVSRLEFPLGHVLFRSAGWVSHPRVSPRGDRIAFIDHGKAVDGRVRVITLDGRSELWSPNFTNVLGLAWTRDGSALYVAAGFRNLDLEALWLLRPGDPPRLVYRAPNDLILADAAPDGRLLVAEVDWRSEVELVGASGQRRPLAWADWAEMMGLSDDASAALTTESGRGTEESGMSFLWPRGHSAPARIGVGQALALSPDGRLALMEDAHLPGALTLVPTGPGEARSLGPSGLVRVTAGAFFRDGRRVALLGRRQPADTDQAWILDIQEGKLSPLSPVEVAFKSKVSISVDERRVAVSGADGAVTVLGLRGEPSVRVPEWTQFQGVAGWLQDGSLVAFDAFGLPSRIERRDATGKVSPLSTFMPSDAAGVQRVVRATVTPDGTTFAFEYRRESGILTQLEWPSGR